VIHIAVTPRSFRNSPGAHHDLLKAEDVDARFADNDKPMQADEMVTFVEGCVGLIVGTDQVTDAVLTAGPLRAVVKFGSGLDSIDLDAARDRKVAVDSTPGANARSVAELAIGLMLALARDIPLHDRAVREGQWARRSGMELEGKTLGLIGCGAIGSEVLRMARGLGMEVLVHDPYADTGALNISLDQLLPASDIVSLHMPLTDETAGMINADRLRAMKQGALLINTARGGVVDEEALVAALQDGHLGGAAFDSFASEPPGDSPLLRLDSFIASPHAGASTVEAAERTGVRAVRRLLELLKETT
jgi:D-3-phosphoglycerate dehydrogenase / 2-oxoglutarate reductase